jgi:hypothetical protein
MTHENADAAKRIKIHGSGEFVHGHDGGNGLGFKVFIDLFSLLGVVRVVVSRNIQENSDQGVVDLFRGRAVLEGQVQMLRGVAQRDQQRAHCALVALRLPSSKPRSKAATTDSSSVLAYTGTFR